MAKHHDDYPKDFPRSLIALEPPLPAMELLDAIRVRCERGQPLKPEQMAYLAVAIRSIGRGFNKWAELRERGIADPNFTIPPIDKHIQFASALFFKRPTRGAPSRHLSAGNVAICQRIEALRDAGSTRDAAIRTAALEHHLGFEATEGIYDRTAKALKLPKRVPMRRKPRPKQ